MDAVALARLCPSGLARLASKGFERPPHVALIERHLLAIASGCLRRLRVALPPRHGKTAFLSHAWPAWFLCTFPSKRVILIGATASLAESYSRKVRDIVSEHGRHFGAKVRSDSRSVERWDTVQGGGVIAVGAGSALVGRGADLLVADDVIAGADVMTSKIQRERLLDWWRQDCYPRQEPGAAVVVVGTRYHELDLHGHLEAEEKAGGERWEKVILPALCEDQESDPLHRPVGAPLWEARYPASELERIRTAVGSHVFAGLYQQRPVPLEGATFKAEWLTHRYGATPDQGSVILDGETIALAEMTRVIGADLAMTLKETSDYTALVTLGTARGKTFVLDVVRRRVEGPGIVPLLEEANARWRPQAIFVESYGFGLSIIQAARATTNLPIRESRLKGDKKAKALPVTAAFEGRRLFLPARAPWLEPFESELLNFGPAAEHDDMVDGLSIAYAEVGPASSADWWSGPVDMSPEPANPVTMSALGGRPSFF